mgnify:CR=1 FL=1
MGKTAKIISLFLLIGLMLLSGFLAFADSSMNNTISSYDINVRINSDGSLDITDKVNFTSLGSYNNTMLLIDNQENEEIEIKNVYMLQKDGYIECERFAEGEWTANVFSGSYSVIQETGNIKLKVYGTFSKRYGSIVVQYKVKNAIKRYKDVAEYRRTHVFKNWGSRISNINISVYLPSYTDPALIRPYLHGVLVGKKNTESRRVVHFNIPDTVPGEYIEAGIIFPQDLVYKAEYKERKDHLEQILREEAEYSESDKEELLRARENAAKEAGRRAWAEKMTQRARAIAASMSILASLLGIYTIWRIYKKLHQLKKTPVPLNFNGIEHLSPAEVRLVISNSKIGARAVLGNLFCLASRGYLIPRVIEQESGRPVIVLDRSGQLNDESLSQSDLYLLDVVMRYTDEEGHFNPSYLLKKTEQKSSGKDIKESFHKWEQLVTRAYFEKNALDTGLLFYRNTGLIYGAILFLFGCIVPVSLSIWSGYSMLIVGLTLFLYTLRIRRHTDYGISKYRLWKEMKKRLLKRQIALDGLPQWMIRPFSFLGYSLALGTETELVLFEAALKNEKIDFQPCHGTESLGRCVKETLSVLDRALSSVRDIL